jgi:hypothetical protein
MWIANTRWLGGAEMVPRRPLLFHPCHWWHCLLSSLNAEGSPA